MDEDTDAASFDEEYWDVERAFLENLRETYDDDGHFDYCQYNVVFEHLIPKIRRSVKNDGLPPIYYESRLRDAEEIVDEIASALSSGWGDKKRGWIWFKPTVENLNLRPDTWEDVSPVNLSSLDSVTARYLQRPWMQLNLLDWYILNGYVFDEAARLADAIKSGQAIGIINWAYIFSGGNIEKTLYWRVAFEISKFLARWILTPAIIIAVYYVGYHGIAKWIAIPYGIYVIIHVAFFPRRYLRRKALAKELDEYESKLKALIGVYQSSSPEIFNPCRLRDLIARAESEEVLLRPAVYSILDRAINRDAAVFAIEGGG